MLVPKGSDKHGRLFGLSYFQVCIVCGCSLRESGVHRFGSVAEKGCVIRQEADRRLIIFGHRRVTGNKSYKHESSGIVYSRCPTLRLIQLGTGATVGPETTLKMHFVRLTCECSVKNPNR